MKEKVERRMVAGLHKKRKHLRARPISNPTDRREAELLKIIIKIKTIKNKTCMKEITINKNDVHER